jgi:hypothetical protein
MRYMIAVLFAALAVIGPAGQVAAQTTRPADAAVAQWNATCHEFVQVMSSGNTAGVAAMLTGGARITSFSAAGQTTQSLVALDASLTGQTVISLHGYLSPATALAADVSADFAANPSLPASAITRMSFAGEDDQKKASSAAAKWITQALSAADGQPVGIAVLWPAAPSATAAATFIIFSGQPSPDGSYKISAVVFGDPLAP